MTCFAQDLQVGVVSLGSKCGVEQFRPGAECWLNRDPIEFWKFRCIRMENLLQAWAKSGLRKGRLRCFGKLVIQVSMHGGFGAALSGVLDKFDDNWLGKDGVFGIDDGQPRVRMLLQQLKCLTLPGEQDVEVWGLQELSGRAACTVTGDVDFFEDAIGLG